MNAYYIVSKLKLLTTENFTNVPTKTLKFDCIDYTTLKPLNNFIVIPQRYTAHLMTVCLTHGLKASVRSSWLSHFYTYLK